MASGSGNGEGRLEFRLLGPLEVTERGRSLELGAAKQRALLALLLIHRREVVSSDRLVEELWGGRPPATAGKALQVYVSRLRKVLGAEALVTGGGGYRLALAADQLDVDRFETLAQEGHRAFEEGDPQRSATVLREGLELWRGPPLADFAYESFAQPEIGRLEQARLGALEDRIEADLALGRHAELIGELESVAGENPQRERLHGQLMLALYRSGRQADALERYTQLRRRLIDELGIEPTPELQQLQAAILAQDPSIDAPRRPALVERIAARSRVTNGAILLAGGGLVLLAAAIGAAVISSGGEEGIDVAANSVAVIDPSNGELVADIPVGARPGAIAAGENGLWVANIDDDSISQIDPKTQSVTSTTGLDTNIDGLGVGEGGVWASDIRRGLAVRLSPVFRNVVDRIDVRSLGHGIPSTVRLGHAAAPVAVGAGSVWVGNGSAAITRIDPTTNKVRGRTDVGNDPSAIAVGATGVWVTDEEDNTVTRIDPTSAGAVAQTIPVGEGPSALAVGEGAVWVANTRDNTVARIDPNTGSAIATIPVGERPTGVAVGAGLVWVANSLSGTVSQIDPEANRVVGTVQVGQGPQALTFAEGKVWVSAQSVPEVAGPTEGGSDSVLRVLLSQDPGPTDPALTFADTQRAYATCALLFNYPDDQAPEGGQLIPEVAQGPPTISDDGRTYTFTLRPEFRFSPPSNEPVTAEAFERSIERALDPRTQSLGGSFIQDIVGAKAFATGHSNHVAGIRADGDTLEVRLTRPVPDLLARLAAPWFCAVPPETPITQRGVPVVPSAGPYYVDSYVPDEHIILRTNPNYPGSRPREFAEIDYEIGIAPERAVTEVEEGSADYYSNGVQGGAVPPALQARLEARYGPGSAAARAGRQQYFVESDPSVFYLAFNTQRPPFDDARLRRAVNYALDRPRLAREPFPLATGRPTDQYIPPGSPGFSDAVIYPLGRPDVKRAKELAGDADRRATLYTCNLPPCAAVAEIVRANLAAIGIDVEVRQFPIPTLFQRLLTPGEPFDLAQVGYAADFADPFDFINLAFESGQVTPPFDDPVFERRMAEAAGLTGAARYRAYARLDRDMAAEAAPAAAYASGTTINLFSARIGCQTNQPIYGIDLGRLCVRP